MKVVAIVILIAQGVIIIQNRISHKRIEELESTVLEGIRETVNNRSTMYKLEGKVNNSINSSRSIIEVQILENRRQLQSAKNEIKVDGILRPRFFIKK